MKVFFAAPSVVLAVSLLSIGAFAQFPLDEPPRRDTPEKSTEQKLNEALAEHNSHQSRPRIEREDRAIKKGLLAPSEDDRVAFAEFLRGRNTGLIRLLPREVYDSETYHTEKKIDMRGGGAYYSFSDLTHAYGYGSDIELDHNRLTVGFAGADYGMLASLGEVPLEALTLDDPRVQFLSSYEPPKLEPLARAEARRFRFPGVTIDGLHYQRSLPVNENTTYLLRSIGYGRTDVLVAFHVVRKDTDGSVIIAWKRLKNYPKSELVRN